MQKSKAIISLAILGFLGGETFAQSDIFVFPNEGQSNEQMEKDKAECHYMAGQQTGYGMTAPSSSSSAWGGSSGGETVTGAAKGAAWGAAIGAISGNAGKGAKWGALGGAVLGSAKKRNQRREQEQAQNQMAQQQAAQFDNYKRAMTACLNARGYSVQ